MEIINSPTEFEWDRHNIEHIRRHGVEPGECEQVFFNIPLIIKPDVTHSHGEERYFALGDTDINRTLVVIFTIRKLKIRIITARDAHKKERINYDTQKDSSV